MAVRAHRGKAPRELLVREGDLVHFGILALFAFWHMWHFGILTHVTLWHFGTCDKIGPLGERGLSSWSLVVLGRGRRGQRLSPCTLHSSTFLDIIRWWNADHIIEIQIFRCWGIPPCNDLLTVNIWYIIDRWLSVWFCSENWFPRLIKILFFIKLAQMRRKGETGGEAILTNAQLLCGAAVHCC